MLKISDITICIIILLSLLAAITTNSDLNAFQIILELCLMAVFAFLSLNLKFKRYELIILILFFLTYLLAFPFIGTKSLLLAIKQSIQGFLALIIMPKLLYNVILARKLLNIFLIFNAVLTIFGIQINFFTSNELISNGGGLLQNFHFNGFIIGIWAISILKKIDYKQLLLGFAIFQTDSKTSFISYFLSIIYFQKKYLMIRIKQIRKIHYLFFGFIISLFIIFFIISNLEILKYQIFLLGLSFNDRSMYVLFDQITNLELLKSSFSIIPGDFEEFDKVKIFSQLAFKDPISNEIAFFYYLNALGIINFASLSLLIFKNCKKLIPIILISSIHYSYILNPLTYIIFFVYTSTNPDKNLKNK